jgi:hypothetical protein
MGQAILLGLVGCICFMGGHYFGYHKGLTLGWTNGWANGWTAVADIVRQGTQALPEAPPPPPPSRGLRVIPGGKDLGNRG